MALRGGTVLSESPFSRRAVLILYKTLANGVKLSCHSKDSSKKVSIMSTAKISAHHSREFYS